MKFEKLLEQKIAGITEQWFNAVADTYPSEAAKFIKGTPDSFDNPVGSTTHRCLESVLRLMITGGTRDEMTKLLDPVIRIRAVQDFTAAQSIAFIFLLKKVLREQLKEALKDQKTQKKLSEFNDRIDALALIAFDIYMGCKEQIYAFRATHVKDRTLNLLKKADVLCEVPEVGTEIIPHNVYKDGGFGS